MKRYFLFSVVLMTVLMTVGCGTKLTEPESLYCLTVNNGYGDGEYAEGDSVEIFADLSLTGWHFVAWIGDVTYVADPTNPETSVMMPGQDVEVTAIYAENPAILYHLTVNSGYGDGDYAEGTVINIYADAPLIGWHFVAWIGDITYVADPTNPETSVTMPGQDIEVLATYEQDVVVELYIKLDLKVDDKSCHDVLMLYSNVVGNCSEQITYLILNGSEGPMLAISLIDGRVYKFNSDGTTYYAGWDCEITHVGDMYKIDLGQPHLGDYNYTRFAFVYGPEIITTQWYHDGRCGYPLPILLSANIYRTVADKDQWWTMNRGAI